MLSRAQFIHTRPSLLPRRTPYTLTKPRVSHPPRSKSPTIRFIHSKSKTTIRFVHTRKHKGESLYTTIKRAERRRQGRARKAAKKRQDAMVENLAGLVVGGFILGWLCVRLREGRKQEVEEYEYEEVCGHVWLGGYP